MPPSIAVILNITESGAPLTQMLASLRAQTAAQALEIVAVANGAGESATAQLAAEGVRTFRQAQSLTSAAWNLGIFAATAPIVVLAPANQTFAPNCTGALLAAHARHSKQGDVIYTAWSAGSALQQAIATAPDPWRSPHGAISFKRALHVNHGVFDPRFDDGWERAEWLWRIRSRRIRLTQAPDALVQWSGALSFADECERNVRQGRAHARLAALHDSPLMRSRAEIGAACSLWAQRGASLDAVMQRAAEEGAPAAYREALNLCRAKGAAAEIAGD